MPTDVSMWEAMNFSSFECLKILVIDYMFLFGADADSHFASSPETAEAHVLKALPISIGELSITECISFETATATLVSLKSVLNNRANKFTGLEKIRWRIPAYGKGKKVLRDNDRALHELAKRQAVDLTLLLARLPSVNVYYPSDICLTLHSTAEDWRDWAGM